MKLVVGLGNPGQKYLHTRHNRGFDAVDLLAKTHDVNWSTDRDLHAERCTIDINDMRLVLAKPTTFMNLSGQAVQALISFYRLDLEDVLIVHDEMDIAEGRLQFVAETGPGGNNGVADIEQRLDTKRINRLRIGIGRPPTHIKSEDWVLGRSEASLDEATEAIIDWAFTGMTTAMNRWNQSKNLDSTSQTHSA